MESKYLVIVRHAERLDDAKNRDSEEFKKRPFAYQLDSPLSYLGMEQATLTGEFIAKRLGITETTKTKVYSSPYTRCIQTAAGLIIGAKIADSQIYIDEQLSEM